MGGGGMKKIVYFYSEDELLWHGGRSLEDLIRDPSPNVYSHRERRRLLRTRKDWNVVVQRVDEVYSRGGYAAAERLMLEKAVDAQYLLFLVSARPQFLTDRTFRAIKARHPATQILLDSHDEVKHHAGVTRYLAADADAILVSDHPMAAEILRREFGNAVFFHEQSRIAFPPCGDGGFDYDLSFIGTAKNRRAAYTEAIAEALPELRCRFVLPKRPSHKSPERLDLEAIRELTCRSRINLVCNEKSPGVLHVSRRLWQVLVCGGLALVEYAPDLEHLFDIEDDLFVYRNESELLAQIRFLLDPIHAEVVERRRKRACERATRICLEDLIERMDGLLPGSEILGKLGHPASLATVPVDPPRLSTDRYRATRYHYLLRFLAKGQLDKVLPELPVLKYGWPSRELLKKARRPLLDRG